MLAYLANRTGITPTFDWRDVWEAEHAQQFTISRLARADLLAAIQEGITAVVGGDLSRRDWMKSAQQVLADAGWWGEKQVVDPATGGVVSTRFNPPRLKLILDTNAQVAYSAGQWARINDAKATHPYVRYITRGDERVRASHAQWNGVTLPVDDPFWNTHWPPNGWRCRCRVQSMTRREYARRVDEGSITTTAPPADSREWINPRTGEVLQVPAGIDPGWAYNPGQAGARAAEIRRQAALKLAALPADIGAVTWPTLDASITSGLADDYRTWLAALPSNPVLKSQTPIIGAIAPADLTWLSENSKALPTHAAIGVSSGPIVGPKARRHEKQGNALPDQVWENLPELMAEPLAVLYDTQSTTLLYVLPDALAKRGQVAVEFDYKRKDRTNVVISGYRPQLSDLQARIDNGSLVLMRGELK
jgi:SPP1 gp7 family putative phage head morphogenesis protein